MRTSLGNKTRAETISLYLADIGRTSGLLARDYWSRRSLAHEDIQAFCIKIPHAIAICSGKNRFLRWFHA
jgi:hypothetical protein